MPINKELLIKLCRLANNNPNDNEANLAARKVCKMLEEDKFNSISSTKVIDYHEINSTFYSTCIDCQKIFNINDLKDGLCILCFVKRSNQAAQSKYKCNKCGKWFNPVPETNFQNPVCPDCVRAEESSDPYRDPFGWTRNI